jgi:hypothetical protein
LAVLAAILASGCEEKEVTPIKDEDQLVGIIEDSEDGRELFRADDLVPSEPYRFPGDTTTWVDSVHNSVRTYGISMIDESTPVSEWADWGQLGILREAVVSVTDELEVARYAVNSPGVLPDTANWTLRRFGFFLKLGDDSEDFLGWRLWGYNSSGSGSFPLPLSVDVDYTAADGTPLGFFRGDESAYTLRPKRIGTDFRFLPMADLVSVGGGAQFRIQTSVRISDPMAPRYFPLLSAEDVDGMSFDVMNQVSREEYRDTVYSPNPNGRLWNIICIHAVNDQTRSHARSWCFPYRVPQ